MATMRSPNYPQVGLGQAIELIQAIWDREKRSYTSREVIARAWGYGGLNGAARVRIGALNRYGLFEESGDEIRLSDDAINILHNPADSSERLAALRKAALAPELFKELQQTYPHASDETIRSYLLTKRGFSDTGAENCVEAFRDTQKAARLNDMGTAMEAQSASQPPPPGTPSFSQQPITMINRQQQPPAQDAVTTFRWPLSRGVSAEVRFIGDVKPAHLDLLKRYLDVAKDSIEEEQPKASAVSLKPSDFAPAEEEEKEN